MLSQYTWGDFFLFVLVVLVLYYVGVAFLYYRDDISNVLKGKRGSGGLAVAGAGTSPAGPPSLVRSKSAFVAAPTATESAPTAESPVQTPADGAAENLPEASAAVVGGELPNSTATATGRDESDADEGPMDLASATVGATAEAIALDESRQEQADRPDAVMAAKIRQKAHDMVIEPSEDDFDQGEGGNPINLIAKSNTDRADIETKRTLVGVSPVETEIVYTPAVADSYEPLADFGEPVASFQDVTPLETEELFEVDSVAAYISQVQAGEKPMVPAALAGTRLADLADQLALNTSQNTEELISLFDAEPE